MAQSNQELYKLVEKYNVAGPRYTSYPTAVQFETDFNQSVLDNEFRHRQNQPRSYSLYIHIPFCFSLCWYCGCTKVITKDQDRGSVYLDFLEKEMKLISDHVHPESKLKQIHFGGGTPTFLNPDQLIRLGELIQTYFSIHPEPEYSVEIDPRRVTEEHVKALSEIGCNRASLGVQDTNPDVQKAIHRIQPFEQTQNVSEFLRKHGISQINLDLIYGLPKQTPESFRQTLDDALSLDPDRFAIYSYAHIPSVMPAQKLLNEEDFPSTPEKLNMLLTGIGYLQENGYDFIGMDHFAKENDELSKALHEGTLHRNFQGYSTHAELDMLALGMSGISQSSRLFYQNSKDLDEYYRLLDQNQRPIKKAYSLTDEDNIRKKIIMQIMCRGEINYSEFQAETGVHIPEKYSAELDQLSVFEADGLLIQTSNGFYITETGRLFLRNIAMVFDEYLKGAQQKTTYSKTV
ncbi:MAG: oxygen-independent coproporphyrinogen III oxidase [Balneolaceae bacterium]|nr:oxygen-independent coproporphyrinogen III oxidase [Balneolaceae bacterium]